MAAGSTWVYRKKEERGGGGGHSSLSPPPKALGMGGSGKSVEDTVPSRGLAHWGAQIPGCPTPCGPSSAPFPLPLLRTL